jgi:hypothetical protein
MRTTILDRIAFLTLLVTVGVGSVLIAIGGVIGVVVMGVCDLFAKDK